MFEISFLSKSDYDSYARFLLKDEKSLFYLSLRYKLFLEMLLSCESRYLIAKDQEGGIVGAFPLMISKKGKFGRIGNSLPYFGSNGSAIVDQSISFDDQSAVRRLLLEGAEKCCENAGCGAQTIVTSPFERSWERDESSVTYDFLDKRIGQITPLPESGADLEDRLMSIFQNPRPRNIRKAINSSVSFRCSYSEDDMKFLYRTHKENISGVGGVSKDESFFSLVPEVFDREDYRVYVAEKEGKRVAALLLFYFNRTVEYFTPAVVPEARSLQPSALIIFEAMKDAITAGYRFWNWGGTWLAQTGVYDFKKRWGAVDHPYRYFTKIFDKRILTSSKKELLNEYPGFFVIPFDEIEKSKDSFISKRHSVK